MRWYELAKIVHFMGLVALFGFFMINVRSGMRLRAATQLSDVRTWLGVLQGARGALVPQLFAIVHDAHGVRFVAAAHSQHELEAHVVDYILERCDYVLWPREAANVRELLACDRNEAAIAAYFANVGQRWDLERLELLDGSHLPSAR